MQKCSYCGADLPANARFCGRCGSSQDVIATDAAATRSNTLPPQSWVPEGGTLPATWSPNVQVQGTPPPVPFEENEDERRRGIVPWSSQYSAMYDTVLGGGALLGSGQATPGVPGVQGTPQMGSVPGVAGSPSPYTSAPVSPPTPGPANASAGHLAQELANVPVSHPAQGSVHTPFPQTEPRPTHEPPEQPGTQEHQAPHKPHEHRTHPAKHAPRRAARVTKVAGGSTVKTVMIVVAAVVVVASGGVAAAAHFLSLPQPLISVTSNYRVGNAPAGASGTILHISGQKFSSNSPITLLLDGHVAPGSPGTRSDSNGNFSSNVAITDAWGVGTHTLTARDASNYSTKNSVGVTVVQQGQANTPGPDGAPPDDATFRIKVTNAANIADPFSSNPVLIITGHPDPEGGTVCSPDDSGQSFTFNETTTGNTPFTKTITATCSGTYKAGQISYIETTTSLENSYQSNGVNVKCVLNNATVDLRLTGAYVGNNTFRGTINSPYFAYTCDPQGYSMWHEASQGVTWTGTIVTQ